MNTTAANGQISAFSLIFALNRLNGITVLTLKTCLRKGNTTAQK